MRVKLIGLLALAMVLLPVTVSCSDNRGPESPAGRKVITSLDGSSAFRQALADAGDALVVIDFYADWCGPCRQLSPMLEEIARKHGDKATFYKVNVDRNRDLARAYRVAGIPHVLFIRRSEAVHSIIGVQHPDAYLRAIGRFAADSAG